jgi:hypothetical protein
MTPLVAVRYLVAGIRQVRRSLSAGVAQHPSAILQEAVQTYCPCVLMTNKRWRSGAVTVEMTSGNHYAVVAVTDCSASGIDSVGGILIGAMAALVLGTYSIQSIEIPKFSTNGEISRSNTCPRHNGSVRALVRGCVIVTESVALVTAT